MELVHNLRGIDKIDKCIRCGKEFKGKQIMTEILKEQSYEFDKENNITNNMELCSEINTIDYNI